MGGAERDAKEATELLHCETFDMNTIQNKLKPVTSCSVLFRESSSRMPEN